MSNRAEVTIPGATTDELVRWATSMQGQVSEGIPPFRPGVGLAFTDQPFMGVELTFTSARGAIFTLALFADIPTEKEKEIMEDTTEKADR